MSALAAEHRHSVPGWSAVLLTTQAAGRIKPRPLCWHLQLRCNAALPHKEHRQRGGGEAWQKKKKSGVRSTWGCQLGKQRSWRQTEQWGWKDEGRRRRARVGARRLKIEHAWYNRGMWVRKERNGHELGVIAICENASVFFFFFLPTVASFLFLSFLVWVFHTSHGIKESVKQEVQFNEYTFGFCVLGIKNKSSSTHTSVWGKAIKL